VKLERHKSTFVEWHWGFYSKEIGIWHIIGLWIPVLQDVLCLGISAWMVTFQYHRMACPGLLQCFGTDCAVVRWVPKKKRKKCRKAPHGHERNHFV
jgi:hypothetical protein